MDAWVRSPGRFGVKLHIAADSRETDRVGLPSMAICPSEQSCDGIFIALRQDSLTHASTVAS